MAILHHQCSDVQIRWYNNPMVCPEFELLRSLTSNIKAISPSERKNRFCNMPNINDIKVFCPVVRGSCLNKTIHWHVYHPSASFCSNVPARKKVGGVTEQVFQLDKIFPSTVFEMTHIFLFHIGKVPHVMVIFQVGFYLKHVRHFTHCSALPFTCIPIQ